MEEVTVIVAEVPIEEGGVEVGVGEGEGADLPTVAILKFLLENMFQDPTPAKNILQL